MKIKTTGPQELFCIEKTESILVMHLFLSVLPYDDDGYLGHLEINVRPFKLSARTN